MTDIIILRPDRFEPRDTTKPFDRGNINWGGGQGLVLNSGATCDNNGLVLLQRTR